MKNHPHDEFFKYLFSLIEVTKEFLENFLPEEVLAVLDLDTLVEDTTEYTTPELAAVISDKVFRCSLRPEFSKNKKRLMAAIAILLEHKSYAPPYPHFQLNEYRQRIWSNRVDNKKKPFAVLPIILYHGTTKWKKKDLVDYFGNLPDALKPYTGGFDYILIDLSKFADGELLRLKLGFLAYGMLTMKHAQDKQWLQEQLRTIFEKGDEFLKTTDGQNFVERLFVYYARIAQLSGENLKKAVTNNLSENMQTTTLSTYDQIKLEGKIEGKLEGKEEKALAVATNLMIEFPQFSDKLVAKISTLKIAKVKKLRQELIKKGKIPKNPPPENGGRSAMN